MNNTPSPTKSIIAFGDSWTYGLGVKSNEKWTTVLSKMLNTNITNKGERGAGIKRIRELINDISTPNDIILLLEPEKSNYMTITVKGKTFNLTRLHIDELIRGERTKLLGKDKQWHIEQYRSNIEEYKDVLNKIHCDMKEKNIEFYSRSNIPRYDKGSDTIHGGPLTHKSYAEWFYNKLL